MYYNYTYMKHSFIIIVFIFRERYEFFLSQHIRAIFSQVATQDKGQASGRSTTVLVHTSISLNNTLDF